MKQSAATPALGNAGVFQANTSGRASRLCTEHLPPAPSGPTGPVPGKGMLSGTGHLERPAGDTGLSALTPPLAEGRWRCAHRDPGWKDPRWRRKFKPLDRRGD